MATAVTAPDAGQAVRVTPRPWLAAGPAIAAATLPLLKKLAPQQVDEPDDH